MAAGRALRGKRGAGLATNCLATNPAGRGFARQEGQPAEVLRTESRIKRKTKTVPAPART